MTTKNDDKSSIEAAFAVDAATGKVEARAMLTNIEAFTKCFRPKQYVQTEVQLAVVDNIRRQLASGTKLSELSELEQSIILDSFSDNARKVANGRNIAAKAFTLDPQIKGLLEAPKPEVPDEAQTAEEQVKAQQETDDQQLFWERFWADAEVVSVEYMQALYAKILAGKVRSPNAFSLRALDVVRSLDEQTANIFLELAPYVCGGLLVPDLFDGQGFAYDQVLDLGEAGLVSLRDVGVPEAPHFLMLGRWLIRLVHTRGVITTSRRNIYALTRAGAEMLKLTNAKPDFRHLIDVCWSFASKTWHYERVEVAENVEGPWVDWRTFCSIDEAFLDVLRNPNAAMQQSEGSSTSESAAKGDP